MWSVMVCVVSVVICGQCWYMCLVLVYMVSFGTYAQCWYMWSMLELCPLLIYVVSVNCVDNIGIYAHCWYMLSMLVCMVSVSMCGQY